MTRLKAILVFVVAIGCAVQPAFVHGKAALKQQAIVFIQVDCEDPKTGAISTDKGTGFIVEKSGFLVTASHVISCWDSEAKRQLQRERITVRFGSPWEEPGHQAEHVRSDDAADVAILKVLGAPKEYPTLEVCSLWKPAPELQLIAAGFPKGGSYQPVPVMIGNSEHAGFWSAQAPFARGMSGGPVAYEGIVVGLVKGGRIGAIGTITPIYRATTVLANEVLLQMGNCGQYGTKAVLPRNAPIPVSNSSSLNKDRPGCKVLFIDNSVSPPRTEKICE